MKISVKYSGDYSKLLTSEVQHQIQKIHQDMDSKCCKGADYLGWVDWPSSIPPSYLNDLQATVQEIREKSNVLVIVGIGGSYLGARAIIEALQKNFQPYQKLEVIFAGHFVSGTYLKNLMGYLDSKEVTINVISKSGTTTEPAIAFRFLKQYMEKRYGEDAASRIIVTTDEEHGALRSLAIEKGYKRLSIPKDIGGRYSVFTAVGLIPIAAAGYNIEELLIGAKIAQQEFSQLDSEHNAAIQYAIVRKHLYDAGYPVEILASFDDQLKYIQEWWKQLFAESEGKDGKGIFPTSAIYTTDLHSLGQYIQEGKRMIFETFLLVEKVQEDLAVFESLENGDELNYVSGLSLHELNHVCYKGTSNAHLNGGVPQLAITIDQLDERNLGYLFYFFMVACAYSAYLLDINPFDQPGVEEYKTNIFTLLKKPGYC